MSTPTRSTALPESASTIELTTAPPASAGAASASLKSEANPRRWWLLAIVALAQLTVVLDGTIVNIALPQAQVALGMSDGDRTWVVTLYSLVFGALLLLGGLLFLTLYFQIVLGYTPIQSGLASLPMTATIMVGAGVLSKFLAQTGVRIPMTVGPMVGAAGLLWMTQITVGGNYALEVLPGLILLGAGLAMIFVPLQNVALSGIAEHDAGAASAAVTAMQQIGGSLGTALFTALYTAAVSSFLVGKVPSQAAQFGALVSGYQSAFLWAAVIIFAAAPIAFFLVRPRKEDLLGAGTAVHLG